jgi:GTP-binding protein EngB required for normal cell division
MLLRTQGIHPGTNGTAHFSDSSERSAQVLFHSPLQQALDLAADVAARYEISALSSLLASARASVGQDEISVAVLGRFKAGKSSFLNHFIGRNVLPVGVVPVTAVVTEIRYGAREEARVYHRDGRDPEVPLDQIGGYISEKENPENTKQVDLITVELPELRRFRGLKFVDTPGLESALSHNTQTSLDWLPNVGLALVAVSVDPPLSQRDIDLLKSLYQFTPKVAVLLTKADLLSAPELDEVVEYVRAQLAKSLPGTPQVFPYSTKPGFERFRLALEAELVSGTLEHLAEERESILVRKMDTLLRECGDYLTLSLKSAEMVQSDRQALKQQVIGEKEIVDEVKSAVRLVVQHAAAGTRSMVSLQLEKHQNDLERALLEAFESEFPKWTHSLATMLSSFEDWLASALRDELTVLSIRERSSFLAPSTKYRSRHSARFNNFETACRIAPCMRSASRCAQRKPRLMLWSPRHPISESAECSTGVGICCRPFCRFGSSGRPFTVILRAPSPIWFTRTLAGSARSGKRASMARCGMLRRSPGDAWKNCWARWNGL